MNNDKPTDFLLDVPEEFQAISQTFSGQAVHDAYPLLHMYDRTSFRDYLPTMLFLQRYAGYRFAWIVEDDVRYTGADWGKAFNCMLNIAVASLKGQNIEGYSDELAFVPSANAILPDLIVTEHDLIPDVDPITDTHKPARDTERYAYKNFHKVRVQLYGVSRRYVEVVHNTSVAGNGGYVEEFVASAAIDEGLDIVSMPYSEFGGADSHSAMHCCFDTGTRYYTDWYLKHECRQYAFVHPVKNRHEDKSVWDELHVHVGR